MTDREEAARAYVQYEILAYLADRSGACDTLDGITNWWLYRQRIADGPGMVSQAVRKLVGEGRLFAFDLADGDTLYAARSDAFPPQYRNIPDEE